MTHEDINRIPPKEYYFGNKKGIKVPYDENTDAVIISETLLKYLLSLIPKAERDAE